MSFKMKLSVANIFTNVFVLYYYISSVMGADSRQTMNLASLVELMGVAIIICGVVFAIFTGIIAAINHRDAARGDDERDKLISLHGDKAGYLTFVLFIVVALIWVWNGTLSERPFAINSASLELNFLHFTLIGFLVSDVIKHARQVWLYQRGTM
ncbi:hypothetical protein ACFSJY_06800 [Thalassotalea euphylliae]|uniref:hypothetical protein n=1 Tax=Thalassotalea euphylliae TaxID=1655234 RepID=UPI003641B6F0